MKISSNIVIVVGGDSFVDILERVLDKGIVIVGDIFVFVVLIEFLIIKICLLIFFVERVREMGINWWEGDFYFIS